MQKGQTQVLILAGIVILIAVAGGIFYLGRITGPKSQTPVTTSSPQPSPTPDETVYTESDRSANWKTYNGKFVIFKYARLWDPTERELFGGAILEDVHLGIPTVTSDQSLGFSGVPLENAKPNDVINEQAIIIGGKSGFKWIRKGKNYVSYDYITRGYNNEGVFDIHVTVASEDKNLEAQLDTLTKSVIFK